MIFLKDKYRIVLDKRNVTSIIVTALTVLFFVFCDFNYATDNGKLALYQTPILIIVVSMITIDMLPNKVNPFHADSLVLSRIDEKQADKVFEIFKNTFDFIIHEIFYFPHKMHLEIENISIGQLKDITLSIDARYVMDTGIKTILINIEIYRLDKNYPLVSFYIPLSSNIKESINEMRISKNLAQWTDIIIFTKTIEYYLLNHQYDGAIKNEKRRI